ncbi:MAG TPA: type II toxin-antitoxin system VapC family toxin [Candidatus Acidoferrum sp.]|nr:type II toxin-antitoxin system VapC family toxin [Candidatus Acidoferrum sp.]
MIILDTNVLSELMLRAPDERVLIWLDQQPRSSIWTTAVTVFEIRFGLESMPVGKRRAILMQDLEKMLDSIDRRIAPFDVEAADRASSLMASRKLQGRPREDRDTMIAGIVLARHATLATRNVGHFDDLSAPVVNPWTA